MSQFYGVSLAKGIDVYAKKLGDIDMATGLNLSTATVTIYGDWFGPNFVNGLAQQTDSYSVVSDTLAMLTFEGGFNSDITYVQLVFGTGFGIDPDTGRFTGQVSYYYAYEEENPQNAWSFTGLNAALDTLNSNAQSTEVTFGDLLVVPLQYDFIGAAGEDVYITGSFNDRAQGFEGNDRFFGLTGDDTLIGDEGNDVLFGNEGADRLYGGDDADTLWGGDDNDVLSGGSGADSLNGGGGNDTVGGGAGNDIVDGGGGNDSIYASDGNDIVAGGAGQDIVYGGTGDDEITGDLASDDLKGGKGQDSVWGGDGSDTVEGGDGNDSLGGGNGSDSLLGGDGNDTIWGGDGSDTVEAGEGNDSVHGGDGTNILYGDEGNDTVIGGTGSDELFGGAGDDSIVGGAAPDFIIGGFGKDTLSANTPGGDFTSDTFIFEDEFGHDTITDFEIGFDGIFFAVGIDSSMVTTKKVGSDVRIEVTLGEGQSILVKDVADSFSEDIDINYLL